MRLVVNVGDRGRLLGDVAAGARVVLNVPAKPASAGKLGDPDDVGHGAAFAFSMCVWIASIRARAFAACSGSRITVSWLSCASSPPADQFVDPVTVSTPSTTHSFRCMIAPF